MMKISVGKNREIFRLCLQHAHGDDKMKLTDKKYVEIKTGNTVAYVK